MQTLRKKTSPCKYRSDPGRFFGDGAIFKAKLIGILEVGEARGDRMCQEALQDLKMAIRAAGEHKQRITINVTIDGLRLRDEKTGDSLYHHPVHKISFIAQDMTDSRAFGYIFGSPDSGHRFFGIKTDKAASQVVLAMRDLFQVVFELKKKEIELARQQIQSKTLHEHQPITLTIKSSALDSHVTYTKNQHATSSSLYVPGKEMSPESVADLVDLEQELSSIQRGITQMERITPNEPPSKNSTEDDPFGDSFTQFPTYNLLPPPESSKSRHSKPLKPPEETAKVSLPIESTTNAASVVKPFPLDNSNWVTSKEMDKFDDIEPSVENNETATSGDNALSASKLSDGENNYLDSPNPLLPSTSAHYIDAFTDLDPLGTGKIKPYIDKKYFFQDLKNPPKKVLKELSDRDGIFSANFMSGSDRHKLEESIGAGDYVKSSDSRKNSNENEHEFTAVFPPEAQIFSPNNISTHGIPITLTPKLNELNVVKTDDPIIGNNKALLVTDNDPFSPRMKKFVDPFDDDFSKKTIDPFEFNFAKGMQKSTILPETKIGSGGAGGGDDRHKEETNSNTSVFNGPLQVSLPPEGYSSYSSRRIERQTSDSGGESIARNRPNVHKQNTVDAISGISSKKMKPLFAQKFTKRESNMRRLQESDSFSENEAPEPPPRPDTNSHTEPPPLPPKKQFSDIVIRPRVTSPLARDSGNKYDYLGANKSSHGQLSSDNIPALPLPSRRIGRTESTYPGPGRPEKKLGNDEDGYLTPITTKNEVPILLPPPQTRGSMKNRGRRQESASSTVQTAKIDAHRKTPIENDVPEPSKSPALPDITLSQLLTLGMDDLASKLNVPVSKLNTMTIVELTKYLSDFIDKTSQKSVPYASDAAITDMTTVPTQHAPPPPQAQQKLQQQSQPTKSLKSTTESAIFKVSFDDSSDATFTAKFDDNFGEDNDFVPNFDQFNAAQQNSTVDKYAVFRTIIEQETKSDDNAIERKHSDASNDASSDAESPTNEMDISNAPMPPKFNSKITEAISHAKDRYAALRDILIEDMFEKPTNAAASRLDIASDSLLMENADDSLSNEMEKTTAADMPSSPEVNISINDNDESEPLKTSATPTITQPICDDLEIDEYMNRALSNMSLDSRDHLSPLSSKSPVTKSQNASTSPIQPLQQRKSPLCNIAEITVDEAQAATASNTLNDMSTSPMPAQRSPLPRSPQTKSPSIASKSPTIVSALKTPSHSNSFMSTDQPIGDAAKDSSNEKVLSASESWAVFETEKPKPKEIGNLKSPKDGAAKPMAESPCSSDDKADWKGDQEYNKKWPRGHTSSSSRDQSPWDDDAAEYRRRGVSHPDRHGFYMRHARRMNSCDDDYEYEEEMAKRRERRIMNKGAVNRSRENFDLDTQNWYHSSNHRSWSPADDEDRARSFERASYERSTYGPPYEKRDPKSHPYASERHGYKGYDKRKYYREYARPGYEIDEYEDYEQQAPRGKPGRKEYDDMYESMPSFGMRSLKSAKEFYYERDKRSFDRESTESFDSVGRRRRSFGSGDMYGSLDSRGRGGGVGGGGDYRDRYMSNERKRSLRKLNKTQRSNEEEYEQDSDSEVRRGAVDTRSLQRSGSRPRKSSGSSPWDGEEVPPAANQKSWKRPASASESDKKLAESRRAHNNALSGSDGEKDRRFYRKPRSRDKDQEPRSNYGHARYSSATRGEDYDYDEGVDYEDDDEHYRDVRRKDRNAAMMADRRKHDSDRSMDSMHRISRSNRDVYYQTEKDRFSGKYDAYEAVAKGRPSSRREREFNYETYEDTPHPNIGNKFNFEAGDQGFESDFNTAPEKNLRFSTDFSGDKDNARLQQQQHQQHHQQHHQPQQSHIASVSQPSPASGSEHVPTPPQQKLRFDDKITVSKFDLFEDDDFSKAEFSFENEDQWVDELPKKINLKNVSNSSVGGAGGIVGSSSSQLKRHEHIRKSESVNIFAKKQDDPFEDDDFFKKSSPEQNSVSNNSKRNGIHNNNSSHNNNINSNTSNNSIKSKNVAANNNASYKWENNFAKFDENI